MQLLFVKVGAIGDVVTALPVLSAVRARYGDDAAITWVAGEQVAPLIQEIDHRVEIVPVSEAALFCQGPRARVGAIFRVWRRIAGRRFDLVVTAYRSWRYGILTLPAFGHRRSFRSRRWRPIPGRNRSDEYVRLVCGDEGPEAPRYSLPHVGLTCSSRLTAMLPAAGGKLCVLAPGGARNVLRDDALRRWPLARYVALARRLLDAGWGVVVTGAPGDAWVQPAFEGLGVCDLVGETSLLDLTAVLDRADIVVTHDSAPLHLAGLTETPVVALFGPVNPMEAAPRREGVFVLWGGETLPCRPCYDGRSYNRSCLDNRCLAEITEERVLAAIRRLACAAAPGPGTEV